MKVEVGQTASVTCTITDQMVRDFARLSGDDNSIHLDEEAARRSRFGKRVAHGMLVASLFSQVMGKKLPGYGTIYLSQTLKFKAPVFIGDTVTAEVKVTAVRPDKPIVTLATTARNQNGEVVIEGEAVGLNEG